MEVETDSSWRSSEPCGLSWKGRDLELDVEYFEKLMEQRKDGTTRLAIDLYRDQRGYIDVATEFKKLENRQNYRFDKNLDDNFGIPQLIILESPANKNPSTVSKYAIDTKGGQKVDADSVVFTQQLRDWMKANARKIMLKKAEEGTWKLEITKQDGTVTHEVTLKNIDRIDYETKDGSLRQPVIPDLATETKSSIDLESDTADKVRRGTMYWPPKSNDCYLEEKEKL